MKVTLWLNPEKDRELIEFIERYKSNHPELHSYSSVVRTLLYNYMRFELLLVSSKSLRRSYERARKVQRSTQGGA